MHRYRPKHRLNSRVSSLISPNAHCKVDQTVVYLLCMQKSYLDIDNATSCCRRQTYKSIRATADPSNVPSHVTKLFSAHQVECQVKLPKEKKLPSHLIPSCASPRTEATTPHFHPRSTVSPAPNPHYACRQTGTWRSSRCSQICSGGPSSSQYRDSKICSSNRSNEPCS